jgi:hypothetical protein
VLSASLRDSQAHCRDLEKQISSALSQVAHGHEAVRKLQIEVGSKDAELSTEQSQSRDLRSQIESLVSDYKRQTEVSLHSFSFACCIVPRFILFSGSKSEFVEGFISLHIASISLTLAVFS